MTYYHVRIRIKSEPEIGHVFLDLSREDLENRVISPYHDGGTIVLGGMIMNPEDLLEILITQTSQDSVQVRKQIESKNISGIALASTGYSRNWRIAGAGEDITDQIINSPPGSEMKEVHTADEQRPLPDTRTVFVVHGRNEVAKNALCDFLRAIDLHPLEWPEAVVATGKSSPYIGEILDSAFSKAQATVILFSPDDEARLRESFRREGDPEYESRFVGQARPNVIYEAGMAMGRNPNRTVLVEIGTLRLFTDVAGLHTIRLNTSPGCRHELAERLRAAGCQVNSTGTHWLTAGDFESALASTISDAPETTNFADQRASSRQELELSEDAKELLMEIARDSSGELLKLTASGGFCFRTNGRHFGEIGDPREEARWEGAVQDLLRLGLLTQSSGGRGKLFKLTREGFEAVDDLDRAL